MTHWFLGRRTIYLIVSCILIFQVCRGSAQDFFAGARGGMSFDGDGGRFRQIEAYGGLAMHTPLYFSGNWYVRPGGDASAGWINEGSTGGFVGTLGPFVQLGKGRFPLTVTAGFAPTILSRYRFSTKDFGDNIQFTSRIGLELAVTRRVNLGLWFQHMSNASLSRSNPGLNLEVFSFRYNF